MISGLSLIIVLGKVMSVRDQVLNQVDFEIWSIIRSQISDKVFIQVRDQVSEKVFIKAWRVLSAYEIRHEIGNQVSDQLKNR